MRETKFIEQNREKWEEFEQELARGAQRDAEKLNELFIQITDDLSYSRTFYPNRSVRVYLNGLAQQIFFRIYKSSRQSSRKLARFWSEELPRLIYESRRDFRLSFFVFLASMAIGALSSNMDPEFPSIILGDAYIEMTKANIESGDPMAVYKQKGEFQMFLGITLNNMLVAVRTFLMGALFLVGALMILVYNGVMVGTFQYFFVERNLFLESFLTIWMHGTLEISAIVIAGAAGLTMGRGLVFPGTFSRLQAFQRSGRRGLKILLGTLPLFLIAGFIEGYFTRATEAPDALRAFCIGVCLLFVLAYFVIYPVYRQRRGLHRAPPERPPAPDSKMEIDYEQIVSSGEVFARLFVIFRKNLGTLLVSCLLLSGLYSAAAFLSSQAAPSVTFTYPARVFGTLSEIGQFFRNPFVPWAPLLTGSVLLILLWLTQHLLLRSAYPQRFPTRWPRPVYLLPLAFPAAGLALLLNTADWYTPLLFLALCPLLLLWSFTIQAGKGNPLLALGRSFELLGTGLGRLMGIFLIVLLFGLTIFNLVDSPLLRGYVDLLSWVVALQQERMDELAIVWLTFINIFLLLMVMTSFILSIGLTYFSLLEILEAPGLRKRIRAVGLRKTIKGLERES